jgi:uncharacterized protein Yka (UPF0111/DUF47 family)
MSENKEMQDCINDIIPKAASIARIVIHTQQAYDILDEMVRFADDRNKVMDSFYKLSRLVTKTLNDFSSDEEIKSKVKDYEDIIKNLQYWSKDLERILINCFNQSGMVKIFASLAISPDLKTFELINAIRRS